MSCSSLMASARCQPLVGSSLQEADQQFMALSYKPGPGISFIKILFCAPSSSKIQEKVKQENILKSTVDIFSLHIS